MTAGTSTALQRIIDALVLHGSVVKESGDTAVAQCPAHDDVNPSLSIGPRRDGRGAVLNCHAGCHYTDILAELKLTECDLFDDDPIRDALRPTKDYIYPNGRINHRLLQPNGQKSFWQEGSGDKSLYAADLIGDAELIYLCEGEKAADFLQALGYTAVATGGSQRTCDLTPLKGRVVVVIADRDPSGHQWAQRQARALRGVAIGVCIMQARVDIDKADIVEHILAGYTVDDLEAVLIEEPNGQVNGTEVHTDVVADTADEDYFHKAVRQKALELRISDEARALWSRQRTEMMGQEPPVMSSLDDFLSIPDEDAQYRVNELFPIGARVLLAAQYKAGKTSLIANLLRALVDGDNFLGRYPVEPIERILLIDTELDERTLRRWLRDQSIRNTGGINVLPLRGRLSSFAINDDRIRADWAKRIGGAQLILLDCLRPCLDALGLSEDKEAGIFLTAFDALCREAGAGEAVVVHHMGHTNERSRGDSRLLDWPDALWKLVRETDENGNTIETGDRFFSAMGRDVNVAESLLDWQPETRQLTIVGGNRVEKKADGAVLDIIDIMHDPQFADGVSKNALVNRLKLFGHGRNVARTAIETAVNKRILYTEKGNRGSAVHRLNPSHREGL